MTTGLSPGILAAEAKSGGFFPCFKVEGLELAGFSPPLPGMGSVREAADIEQEHLGKLSLLLLCYWSEGALLPTTLALAPRILC